MRWSGFRRWSALRPWLVLALLWASGCAREEMPKTYTVKGKVVFKNGQPLRGGMITFSSITDPELRGYGTIGQDGTFTLGTIGHTSKGRSQLLQGAVEGEFYVNIRPNAGSGNTSAPPVAAGIAAFTLRKTYKVEAKENNDLTVVVE